MAYPDPEDYDHYLSVEEFDPDAYDPGDPSHLDGDDNPTGRPVEMVGAYRADREEDGHLSTGDAEHMGFWEEGGEGRRVIQMVEGPSSHDGRRKAWSFIRDTLKED